MSPVKLRVFRDAYVFISFLGFHTSLLIFGVYLLCINQRTLRWPFIVISLFMFTVATADISLSLVFLFNRLLKGRALPVLHPHPKLLFFLTNKYVDYVPFWASLLNYSIIILCSAWLRSLSLYVTVPLRALRCLLTVIAQIYRCYTVWRRRRMIVIISAIFLVASSGKYTR